MSDWLFVGTYKQCHDWVKNKPDPLNYFIQHLTDNTYGVKYNG